MRSRIAAAVVIGLSIACAAPASAAPALPPVEAIVAQFDDVAFGHEHGPTQHVVQKWAASPTLFFYTRSVAELQTLLPLIRQNADAIGRLTGLAWQVSGTQERASLNFGLLPTSDFGKLDLPGESAEEKRFLAQSACIAIAASSTQHPGAIRQGAIVVGTDISAELRRHCLLEEMVQVMGLPNDACHYRPSLFCEQDRLADMAAADKILLKTLYDPDLRPGMPRAEALPAARRIIAALVESPAKIVAARPGVVAPPSLR